eukprot:TRINITY_DN37445_c0_g1_i1.p1 TRINITY_DN37445_c0_g1~~TRINITY_DN37445_c0_g1_i1.p1  ORF type:complete len:307 (+),score=79.07 TRINITY_DN37445_c0_g1_i1:84-1004(+)
MSTNRLRTSCYRPPAGPDALGIVKQLLARVGKAFRFAKRDLLLMDAMNDSEIDSIFMKLADSLVVGSEFIKNRMNNIDEIGRDPALCELFDLLALVGRPKRQPHGLLDDGQSSLTSVTTATSDARPTTRAMAAQYFSLFAQEMEGFCDKATQACHCDNLDVDSSVTEMTKQDSGMICKGKMQNEKKRKADKNEVDVQTQLTGSAVDNLPPSVEALLFEHEDFRARAQRESVALKAMARQCMRQHQGVVEELQTYKSQFESKTADYEERIEFLNKKYESRLLGYEAKFDMLSQDANDKKDKKNKKRK